MLRIVRLTDGDGVTDTVVLAADVEPGAADELVDALIAAGIAPGITRWHGSIGSLPARYGTLRTTSWRTVFPGGIWTVCGNDRPG